MINSISSFEDDPVKSFMHNWSMKNPDKLPADYHNIYRLVSEDMDGNITNEMFALNVMTDYGFDRTFNGVNPSNKRMHLGNGTSTSFPTSSSTLESPISTTIYGTNVDTTRTLIYSKYHTDTGIVTSRFFVLSSYFDYTTFGEDKQVTEIGISENNQSYTQLIFHARVYDINGDPSSFTKRLYERLTVYFYASYGVKPGIILNKLWNKTNPVYALMNFGNGIFPETQIAHNNTHEYDRTFQTRIGSYSTSYSSSSAFVKNTSTSDKAAALQDNQYGSTYYDSNLVTREIQNNVFQFLPRFHEMEYVLDGKYKYMSWFMSSQSGYYFNANILLAFRIKMEEPEQIVSEIVTDNDKTGSFLKAFGRQILSYGYSPSDNDDLLHNYGMIPVVDFNITSLKAWSCQDHDWTIDIDYEQDNDIQMDMNFLVFSTYISNLYFPDTDSYRSFRVWVNPCTNVGITSINSDYGGSYYVTDQYWNPSSWIMISDRNNIPANVQNKKYICSFGNGKGNDPSKYEDGQYGDSSITLHVSRDWTPPQLDSSKYVVTTLPTIQVTDNSRIYYYGYSYASAVSDDYEYFVSYDGNVLIYPESVNPESANGSPYIYYLNTYASPNKSIEIKPWCTPAGDRITMIGGDIRTGIRVYYPNIDPSVAPTYDDFQYTHAFSKNQIMTSSNNGFVVISPVANDTSNPSTIYVLNMYGGINNDTVEMIEITNHFYGVAIELTNYLCAKNITTGEYDVIDMTDSSIVSSITFDNSTIVDGIVGYGNFIYFRTHVSSTYMTYLYRIQENDLMQLSWDIGPVANISDEYSPIRLAVESRGNCESCMVLLNSECYSLKSMTDFNILLKSSDPENYLRLTDNNPDSYGTTYIYGNCAQMKYVNNDEQLILAIVVRSTYVYTTIFDIDRILTNGSIHGYYKHNHVYYPHNDSTYYTNGIIIYKNSIITPYRETNDSQHYTSTLSLSIKPLEYFLTYKITGTTYTIQSFNNPKQIKDGVYDANDSSYTGRELTVKYTNNITMYEPT